MKYIVCYSGGISSALVAIEAVRRHGKKNVVLLNHDISADVEHHDIKRFKTQTAEYLDIPITYANMENYQDNTPLKISVMERAFTNPTTQQALCTYNLKTKPFTDWLKNNFPASVDNICKDITILYGFDTNEKARIQRRSSYLGTMGYFSNYPLAFWDRTIQSTKEIGIEPPTTYKIFKHANCIGCLKAGMQHWYVVYCLRQDIFQEAIQVENKLGYSIIKGHFMKDLIQRFEETRDKGICPNDKGNGKSFWDKVNRTIPEQLSMFPCDCAGL